MSICSFHFKQKIIRWGQFRPQNNAYSSVGFVDVNTSTGEVIDVKMQERGGRIVMPASEFPGIPAWTGLDCSL
jgi:hypothetical protein